MTEAVAFNLNLSPFLAAAPDAPAPTEGLDLAVEAIDRVIKRIEQEMAVLTPAHFETAGTIQSGSFGGADSAPNLALHYTRAHEVTYKTLWGVKEDLVAFQDACRNARDEIVTADEDAADRNNRTLEAVEVLAAGSSHNHGHHENQQAQQNQDTTGGSDI